MAMRLLDRPKAHGRMPMLARLSRSPSDDAVPRARDPAYESFTITRHVTKRVSSSRGTHTERSRMSESRPFASETRVPPELRDAAVARVRFEDLARLPAHRLARLLLERAAEDPTLLSRLYQTVDPANAAAAVEPQAAVAARIVGDSPAMRQVTALLRRFEQTGEP